MRYLQLAFFNICIALTLSAQPQTVGTFINDSASHDGLTLLSPATYNVSYLIDNCGAEVHRWTSEFSPGLSSYLMPEGRLLRTARFGGSFNGGGAGGRLEIISWDDELLWSWNYSSSTARQHHDVELMPNGNILVLAWEGVPRDSAIALGRIPANAPESILWSEHILEIKPIGIDSAEIVWEWHVTDHIVQEFDTSLSTYGLIHENPGKIDINYGNTRSTDWLHCNSVDYNPERDQIIISCRNYSEIWVIDHSTTSAEAATDVGGLRGKGGDLLYRWGNPRTYRRGDEADQLLWSQHDARWIDVAGPDSGKISVYSNGNGRPGPDFSEVVIWEIPYLEDGSIETPPSEAFGPLSGTTVSSDARIDFSSSIMSGAQPLPNGHLLISQGTRGRAYELDIDGNLYWEYQNPVGAGGPVRQSESPRSAQVFRYVRYTRDDQRLSGLDLTPGEPIELDPVDYGCNIILDSVMTSVNRLDQLPLRIYPNPSVDYLIVESDDSTPLEIQILDLSGRELYRSISSSSRIQITHDLAQGVYWLRSVSRSENKQRLDKVIVH